jgi:hypothetical protein
MATKKTTATARHKKTLTAYEVKRLNAANDKYNAHLAANLPVYPDQSADTLRELLAGGLQIEGLGWSGHNLHQSYEEFAAEQEFKGRHRRRHGHGHGNGNQGNKGNNGNKGKHHGGGGGGGQQLMNPAIVKGVVQNLIQASGLTPVGMTGPVKRAVQNFEFLTGAKANWFMDSYELIIPLAHIWKCSEVTKEGLDNIARKTGYTAYCSVENTRGQAVGLLVHPRFKVLKEWSIDAVATVQGIADLRPVHGVDLEDTAAVPADEKTFWAAVNHGKSMRGGPVASGAVRYQQNDIIAKDRKGKGRGTLGGDMNTLIGTPAGDKDISPLINVGFKLVDPSDTRTTQSMGGRLDALFTLDFGTDLKIDALFAWFKDPTIGRGLTDHGAELFA